MNSPPIPFQVTEKKNQLRFVDPVSEKNIVKFRTITLTVNVNTHADSYCERMTFYFTSKDGSYQRSLLANTSYHQLSFSHV